MNLDSAEGLEHAMTLAFPNIHRRAYTSTDFSYSDGSAKKVDGSPKGNQNGQEVAGTYTGTGLVMADTQEVIRINPNGQNTTNTINRAELVGVQAWLKSINQDEALSGGTFKLLTDSQVTLQSIPKGHQAAHIDLAEHS